MITGLVGKGSPSLGRVAQRALDLQVLLEAELAPLAAVAAAL